MLKFIFASKHFVLFIMLIVVFLIFGCGSTQMVPDADSVTWVGKITGMADGDLKLFIKQTEGQGDFHSITGRFVINLESTAGGHGSGTVTGRIKGRVKNGIMKAKMVGHAQVEDGSSHIFGEMAGTISKTQALGTWKVEHREGSHSGKWTAEKMVE